MKLNTRIAAVVVSIAAIISAGVVNTAGAASGPPPVNPVSECNTLSCKGEKVPVEAPAEEPAPVSKPVVAEPKVEAAPKAPIVEKPAAVVVEPAPVAKTEPKSGGCN